MPALARLVVEDDRREHVAVLGDRHRRHLQLDRLVEQLLDPARAVEQRELGVEVEVDEVRLMRSMRLMLITLIAVHALGFAHLHAIYSHSIVDGGFELMS